MCMFFNDEKIQHVLNVSKNFNNVEAYENTLWKINDSLMFNIERVKNDVNGNPCYKIVIVDECNTILNSNYRKCFKRTYDSKGYSIFQSYNLSNSLEFIFNQEN